MKSRWMALRRSGVYSGFKWLVFTFLLVDALLFALKGAPTQLMDSAAWLTLLGIFEWRTQSGIESIECEPFAVRILQSVAYLIVGYSCFGYWRETAWLSFANALVWIFLVMTFEFAYLIRHGGVLRATKAVIYTALVAAAVIWGVQRDYLECFDAMMWIVAFVTIENVSPLPEEPEKAGAFVRDGEF
ncbi:MAG: hypothetical protein AB7S65_04880 [Sulfuricurvum sp.]